MGVGGEGYGRGGGSEGEGGEGGGEGWERMGGRRRIGGLLLVSCSCCSAFIELDEGIIFIIFIFHFWNFDFFVFEGIFNRIFA